MSALSKTARETIKWRGMRTEGVTIAGYVRHYFPDGKWHGDACGCTDDRCRGYHHDEDATECKCLQVTLDTYACGLSGHQWGTTIHEQDYGRGLVRWRNCTTCTASDYLQVPQR